MSGKTEMSDVLASKHTHRFIAAVYRGNLRTVSVRVTGLARGDKIFALINDECRENRFLNVVLIRGSRNEFSGKN